ncbi:MAG: hypothetical protein ACI4CE_05825 [Methanomethylophilus alvi]
MKQHVIARATERFCLDKEHENGILIESFPTGLGKSHEACYAMLDVVQKDPDAKFIFICNQTKNLPYDLLLKIAKDDFKMSEKEFKKLVLPLKSNIDAFTENYKDSMKKNIKSLFAEYDIEDGVLGNVVRYRNLYKKVKGSNTVPEYIEQVRKEYEGAERDFRSAVHKVLKPLQKPSARVNKINTDDSYKWIREIYPVMDFDSYRIILMSDAKFLRTIDPIVVAPFTLWSETDLRVQKDKDDEDSEPSEHSRLLDHILIIDEFDAFKRVIQDTLIEEQKDEVDAVRAFRNLYLRLQHWKNLPTLMITESSWWTSIKKISIPERFKKLIDSSKKIRQKYHMEYLFKQYGLDENGNLTDPPGSSFMFRDYEPYSVGNAFTVRTETEMRYNRILVGKGIKSTSSWFSSLFGGLNELFIQMAKLVRDLAFNYMYAQKDDSSDSVDVRSDEHRSFTNCVDSVIDALDMEPDLAKFIKIKVIHNRLKSGSEKCLALDDPTFFSRGFGYISMRDSINKQLQTHLYYTGYDTTPEAVLRHMAERTKVIAMSATAEVDSPLCNFHIQYLRDSGVYFHEFDDDEKQEVHELIHSLRTGFEDGKSNLHCECLPSVTNYSRATWEDMFDDEDDADDLYTKLGIADEGQTFAEVRYVRVAQAIDAFLSHEDIYSMIGFFSAHVRNSTDGKFTVNKMNYIIEKLAKKHMIAVGVKWYGSEETVLNPKAGNPAAYIIQVNGSNYDEVKDEILSRLSGKAEDCNGIGQKVFLITAYQTLGAGQNLQYDVPDNLADARVWVRGAMHDYDMVSKEKDFDAIYLDDPTNIGPQIEFGKKGTLDNYLFYAEYLDATSQITLDDKHVEIRNAFRQCYTPNMDRQPNHFKKCFAYILAKAQVVNQAVGRMSRTGWKMPNVYLFLDSELVNGGTFALPKEYYGSYLSYEFETLYNEVHKKNELETKDGEEEMILDDCLRISHNFVGYMDDLRFAVYGGNAEAIAKWQELRDFVLHNPTCPKRMEGLSKIQNTVHRYGYIEPPKRSGSYWFTLKFDFDQNGTDGLEIRFDGPPAQLEKEDLGKIWYSVSPETAKLDLMSKIDYVKKFLEEHNIPMIFEPNDKLMSPPLFRNIFMGGLGEIVGKRIIEYLTDGKVVLNDMPSKYYEKFDYSLGNGVFVDFKDWNESNYYDEKKTERTIKFISEKLEACEGSRVYVINIVTDGGRKYEPYHTYRMANGKEIVTIPYLYTVNNGKVSPNGEFIKKLMEDEVDE